MVSDDGALIAAIDEALAAQPDVLEKIREGKVQAAGGLIGAVMKAMKGTADAARVRARAGAGTVEIGSGVACKSLRMEQGLRDSEMWSFGQHFPRILQVRPIIIV